MLEPQFRNTRNVHVISVVKSGSFRPVFRPENANECLCHLSLNIATEDAIEQPKRLPQTLAESPLYRLLKPYLWYMQIWGLFFVDEPTQTGFNFSRLYCGIGIFIQLSSTIFYLLPFYLTQAFESFTVNMLISCLWTVQNGINAGTIYSMCSSQDKTREFFITWCNLITCPAETSYMDKYITKTRNIISLLFVSFHIFFSLGWIIIIGGGAVDIFPSVIRETFPAEMITFMRILFCTTHLYSSAAWSLPAGFYMIICLTLRKLLITYNDMLKNSITYILLGGNANGTTDPFHSEAFRFKHQQILNLLETANGMFGVFILTMILTNMALLCFATYMLVFMCAPSFAKSLEASWTLVATVFLCVLSSAGAAIHEPAHAPYEQLHAVPLAVMSPDNMVKLLVFLNRVGGPEIGISAWGFSVLSKGFLSTLAGMFLSYFFLLVQFQSPTGLSACGQNVTEEVVME